MKYDLTKKLTIGASRTLISLQKAMLTLLSEKSFEEIAVQELCEKSMLPRATFYNYFDDKYDLLDYYLLTIHKQIEIGCQDVEGCQERLKVLMENCIDFFDQNIEIIQNILKNNHPDQYFINQIRFYLITNMVNAFNSCPNPYPYKVPKEMEARLYSEAVLIILEWKYLDKKECSKEQAKEYLQLMVGETDTN